MLKDIKNTLRQSAVYGLSRIAAKFVSFILIPLYTAKFLPDAIANINLLESFWQYLFTICMFAFETAIINFCASQENTSKRMKILFNFFLMMTVNCCLIIFAGLFFSDQIAGYVLADVNLGYIIFYCFLISAFEALLILPMTVARLNNKPGMYTFIAVSNLFINMLLQLYFILCLRLGFEYIFLAKFIAPSVIFILFIPYLLKNLNFDFDKNEIREIIKFSFPLMLAMLLSLLLNTSDRFILTHFVSKLDVAIYTTGYSIGSITNAFILSPFTLAINIIFWKKINDDNFKRFMTKSSTYLFSAMI
ncbi:MAG: oligosaccharide flippase family protein, partial [Ignavibacteria bacterium]